MLEWMGEFQGTQKLLLLRQVHVLAVVSVEWWSKLSVVLVTIFHIS